MLFPFEQEVCYLLIFILLLIPLCFSLKGMNRITIFDKSHAKWAKAIWLFIVLFFVYQLVKVFLESHKTNVLLPENLFQLILLFVLVIVFRWGVAKAETTFIHGKKFKILAQFTALSLLITLFLIGLKVAMSYQDYFIF